ncbi:MAG: SDR family oxidoreductase [Betaproteobacteria bacterium]|nr:SDR family oxidoreductase [Betaproteobacteria bacterium]
MPSLSQFRRGLFAGKVFIVTGGGSGIGLRTAEELAWLGASLVLVGRSADKLASAQERIAVHGTAVRWHACDIRDEARVKAVVADAVAEMGAIDGLVNNAGGQFFSPAERISANGFDAVVRNNLLGGFLFAREVYLQSMKARGGGAIVNMLADMWGGMPGMAHSGAARAGMLNLSETLAYEWAPVRVNAVAPGWIASSGLESYPDAYRPMIERFAELVPAGRLGTEAEVAAGIIFLLSPAAAFISGSVLRIDGAVPNRREHWPVAPHGQTIPFTGDA